MLEVILDTETTGLSIKENHRIVEIGCIELKDQIATKNIFHTYLNDLGCEILYTNTNNLNTPNKAVNEYLDIQEVIKHYNIKDDDMIIKLTGRYLLLDTSFIETVISNIENYDVTGIKDGKWESFYDDGSIKKEISRGKSPTVCK